MSSNNVGQLITKTVTTLQHFATLHHTSLPNSRFNFEFSGIHFLPCPFCVSASTSPWSETLPGYERHTGIFFCLNLMAPDVSGEPRGLKRMIMYGLYGKRAVNVLSGLKSLACDSVMNFTDGDVTFRA